MKRKAVLGIDTSNYTTSVALIGEEGELIANLKRPLPVKVGECGLRQSDAVFAHIKNIPDIMRDVRELKSSLEISAVGVSEKPRNVAGSYMPCFLSGVSVAEGIAAALGVPLFKYSHQCGHIMAAIYSSGRFDLLSGESFAAFHISGGTTEMLRVKYSDNAFLTELIGGTLDLNAGQLIDRVGVYMGLSFPAGIHMEKLALENNLKVPARKPKLSDFKINLSGIENLAKKMYDESANKELVSAYVLNHIADSLTALCEKYESAFGKSSFVFAGGVMSNSIIKEKIKSRFQASFAMPEMSADNAVGIARLTLENLK